MAVDQPGLDAWRLLTGRVPVTCPDDCEVMFLRLAFSAGVPLISGDADLTVLRQVAPVEALRVAGLQARLSAGHE